MDGTENPFGAENTYNEDEEEDINISEVHDSIRFSNRNGI